jgi:hypothetical protein
MAQYAVLIYERVAPEDLPKEIMDRHMGRPTGSPGRAGRSPPAWLCSPTRRPPRSAATW